MILVSHGVKVGKGGALRDLLPLLTTFFALTPVAAGAISPHIQLQVFEIELDESSEASLSHHSTILAEEGWSGQIIFVYPFGIERLFRSPEEILDWEKKVEIESHGCDSTYSFDVDEEHTTVTVDISVLSSEATLTARMRLINVVESVQTYSIPFIAKAGERKRFSFVTATSNLDVNRTKVVVHLPPDKIVSNYLPQENVTVMPKGSEQQSVFWSFGQGAATEARIFMEFGTRGKLGRLMILILVIIILGVVLAALKFLLILDEESITY